MTLSPQSVSTAVVRCTEGVGRAASRELELVLVAVEQRPPAAGWQDHRVVPRRAEHVPPPLDEQPSRDAENIAVGKDDEQIVPTNALSQPSLGLRSGVIDIQPLDGCECRLVEPVAGLACAVDGPACGGPGVRTAKGDYFGAERR